MNQIKAFTLNWYGPEATVLPSVDFKPIESSPDLGGAYARSHQQLQEYKWSNPTKTKNLAGEYEVFIDKKFFGVLLVVHKLSALFTESLPKPKHRWVNSDKSLRGGFFFKTLVFLAQDDARHFFFQKNCTQEMESEEYLSAIVNTKEAALRTHYIFYNLPYLIPYKEEKQD